MLSYFITEFEFSESHQYVTVACMEGQGGQNFDLTCFWPLRLSIVATPC